MKLKIKLPIFLFICNLTFALVASSCGSTNNSSGSGIGGTITGNPVDAEDLPLPNDPELIVLAICGKLFQCFGLHPFNCGQGVRNSNTIDTEIGLLPGEFSDFQEIIDAESNGEIESDSGAADQCQSDIHSLFCSDPGVQNAYNPLDPNNFDNVTSLLSPDPGSCPDVF